MELVCFTSVNRTQVQLLQSFAYFYHTSRTCAVFMGVCTVDRKKKGA